MLLELNILDLAIIDNLSISFGRGLSVFTGDSGAGKSIIIDAIDLVLGARAANDLIRSGKEEARVEALFSVASPEKVNGILGNSGIPFSDTLAIKRIIQKNGKNKIFINDCLSTLATLAALGRHLIDICGQSENQSLAREEEQIELLDSFGNLKDLRREMSDCYARWLGLKKELDTLSSRMKATDADRELFCFQSKEILDANLREGEEEELKTERERLRNAEKLLSAASGAEKALYSESPSVIERLGPLIKELKDAARFDPSLENAAARLTSALCEIEDIAADLRDYSSKIEADPGRLEELEARLDTIGKLGKKYGGTIKEILERKVLIDGKLKGIADYGARIRELSEKFEAAEKEAESVSESLTEERKKKAALLKKGIEREFSQLGMKGAVFESVIKTERNPGNTPSFGEKGADRVAFYISVNPGEEIKPLSKVASGGELSRIMLALKGLTSAGKVPTLIFDEIDAGIGAAMAQIVGKKLAAISSSHQVLCITHLAQIATFAGCHFFVEKVAKGERKVTRVKKLAPEERVEHMARMLGGSRITETAVKHARELLREKGGLE